jgi:hypothetical protein
MPYPLYPHTRGFRPFSNGVLDPPAGYMGVVGPASNEPDVVSLHDDIRRVYSTNPGWLSAAVYGGIHYASYAGVTDGSQFYELPLFARIPSMVTVEIIKDSGADGGTGDATINGETQAFDASGPSGDPLPVTFLVPAGEHLLKVRKLLRQSLYVRSVIIAAA